MLEQPIREVMSDRLTTVSPKDNLNQTIQAMAKANIGAVVVVEDGKPVGIFTERDLLKRVVSKHIDINILTVGQVMTPKIISVDPETSLRDVIKRMYTLSMRHMLIMEGNRIAGIFSLRDLLRILLVVK